MKFKSYSNTNFHKTVYYQSLPEEEKLNFDILAKVFHFKVNNYVLDHLIDWDNVPHDPMYKLLFPRKEMLSEKDYQYLKRLKLAGAEFNQKTFVPLIERLRQKMTPTVNVHKNGDIHINGEKVNGMYSNFRTIVSLSPSPMSRTCHSYCSYCFRWIIFNDFDLQKDLPYHDPNTPVPFLEANPQITDVMFTGADPLVMKVDKLKAYIEPILSIDSVQVIRINSKSLAWWPYRFLTDNDADELLDLFRYIQSKGKHFNFCAHFTHPRELENEVVKAAIEKIKATGAVIRCQGPLVKGINDRAQDWIDLWTKQIQLGLIPYYMFIEANHHTESCFRVPLAESLRIFQEAQKHTTGLARTVRGPVFMNDINRILLDGTTELNGQKYFVLKSLQCSPGLESEGKIKLLPYDEHALTLGNLFEVFNEEVVEQV
ncbi:MAG: KamA family radical SAM protein [Flammeovirgaceae bacterium]